MSEQKIVVSNLINDCRNGIKYKIGIPKKFQSLLSSKFVLKGWIIGKYLPVSKIEVLDETGKLFYSFAVDVYRKDVIDKHPQESQIQSQICNHGFEQKIDISSLIFAGKASIQLRAVYSNEEQENIAIINVVNEVNEVNEVARGDESWLFLKGGSNELFKWHTGEKRFTNQKILSWKKLLQFRQAWLATNNIDFFHIFSPNKISVYPEYYSQKLLFYDCRPIKKLLDTCSDLFLYQLEVFEKYKYEYDVYYHTDTHWTTLGAFLSYQNIMSLMKYNFAKRALTLDDLHFEKKKFSGDLGKKFTPFVDEIASFTIIKNINSQLIFTNNVKNRGLIKKYKNNTWKNGKVIIFGDSFTHMQIPYFAEAFSETIFVHSSFIDLDYIENEKPDIVISSIAERFLVKIPDDVNSPRVEEYAKKLGKI